METFDFTFGPSGGHRRVNVPYLVGVLADLSGNPADPLPPLAGRKFLEIDVDNFDTRLAAHQPRVAFQVPNTVTGEGHLDVDITFRGLDDFSPAEITAKVGLLAKLWAARSKLAAMRTRPEGSQVSGKPTVEELLAQVVEDPALFRAIIPAASPAPGAEPAEAAPAEAPAEGLSDLDRLLGKQPAKTPAPPQPPSLIDDLVKQALAATPQISDGAMQNIGALVGRIDEKLAEQLNLVLHHDDWRALEATWRGIHYLISNTETDEGLKIRILNLSKADLASAFAASPGAGNPLFLMIRGEPFGCLIADYYFDHSPGDVAVLHALGQLGAAAGAVVPTGAAPSLANLDAWRSLRVSGDLIRAIQADDRPQWGQLRASAAFARLALAMPRFLARLPYGAKTNPAEGIDFEEEADVAQPGHFVWANAAYAMGVVITRAVSIDGWNAQLTGAGEQSEADGLPCYAYTDAYGDSEIMCPVEAAIPIEHGLALANCGLMPLLHRKNTDTAVFAAVPSLRGRAG